MSVLNLPNIITFSLLISTISSTDHMKIAKFSTFGYDFKQGMNISCAQQFFNLPEEYENDCRITFTNDNKCASLISDDAKFEDTDELNAQPSVFMRKFKPDHTHSTRAGLNITIPLLNKGDTLGYAIKFEIPQKTHFRCYLIQLDPALKTRANVPLVWLDQYFFSDPDKKEKFLVSVIEIPSLKRQIFQSEVPYEDDLHVENKEKWKPVLFSQSFPNKIEMTFGSAEFPVSGYTVVASIGGKVERKQVVSTPGPFQKVNFADLPAGDYTISVKANCDVCQTRTATISIKSDNSFPFGLVIFFSPVLLILLGVIVWFCAFSKHVIEPKVLRKIFILQSYDCEIHSDFIFALVAALRASNFDVLIDKYRDVETIYDILNWIPDAVKQSHFVLIIWSKGAINKDNDEIRQREPGNTVSANWNFALRQVEIKSQDFEFEVANVFWDKNVTRDDINTVFVGFTDIYLTKNLENDWKKLLSFLYSKDFPLWKRSVFRFYKQDLSSFTEGKRLLQAYDNLKSYTLDLDLIPRERNQNGDEVDFFPLVEIENNDSGFESGRVSNDVFVDDSVVLEPAVRATRRPPKISLKEAMERAENPNSAASGSCQPQPGGFSPVFVPYPVAVPVMMVPQVQLPVNRVENVGFGAQNPLNFAQNTNFDSAGSESAI